MTQPEDYRTLLKRELANRSERNEHYSLRAFARDIHMSPSRLSEVLNGRHGLSRTTARRVAENLGWDSDTCGYFCDLVEATHGRSEARRQEAKARLYRYRRSREMALIGLDTFKLIADWYHLAIVELTKLRGARDDPAWIASTLGITTAQADEAVERLLRLGLLTREQGRLVGSNNTTPSDVPSAAIRAYHRQTLELARGALESQPVPERVFGTSVIAVSRDAVPRAAALIDEFRARLFAELGRTEDKDDLYCLGVQFFRLRKTD